MGLVRVMGWAFNVSRLIEGLIWAGLGCRLPFKWIDLKACGHWAFGYESFLSFFFLGHSWLQG